MNYSNWLLDPYRNFQFLHNLVIGDQASFAMNGTVNTHSVRSHSRKWHHLILQIISTRGNVTVGRPVWELHLRPIFLWAKRQQSRVLRMINEFAILLLAGVFTSWNVSTPLVGIRWCTRTQINWCDELVVPGFRTHVCCILSRSAVAITFSWSHPRTFSCMGM